MDDTEIEAFLTRYAQACADAGVEPLPEDDLAVIARAIVTGALPAFVTLH